MLIAQYVLVKFIRSVMPMLKLFWQKEGIGVYLLGIWAPYKHRHLLIFTHVLISQYVSAKLIKTHICSKKGIRLLHLLPGYNYYNVHVEAHPRTCYALAIRVKKLQNFHISSTNGFLRGNYSQHKNIFWKTCWKIFTDTIRWILGN